jgi:simple sugar transport system ATP-binding protein
VTTSDDNHLLTLVGVARRFGDVVALDDVSLTVRAGSVHALLGENGAGKSTLMRIAFGLLQPDRAAMHVRGAPFRPSTPAHAMSAGIGMVHQHFTLVPTMTVAENIALGGHGLFDPATTARQVRELSARAGLPMDPDAIVGDLPVSAQQRCEIVKSLSRDARILIMDEPTAVLTPEEARGLLSWLRAFADAGNGVVLITHKLRDAISIADEVTVLRHGRVVLSSRRSDIDEDALATAMLGRTRPQPNARSAREARLTKSPVVAEMRDVSVRDARGLPAIRNASLELHGSEIVGVAAVEGSGQHELLRLMASRLPPDSGLVSLPQQVGFIPEDRHRDALLLEADLVSNAALRDAGRRSGRMRWKDFERSTAMLMKRFDVRAAGITSEVRSLSGGNQQKLVVARELENAPLLLVAENPTRGLDFNASMSVHDALRDARDAGTAVLLYSSDLDEVIGLADRVVVLREGRLFEVGRDRELVGRAMLSAT